MWRPCKCQEVGGHTHNKVSPQTSLTCGSYPTINKYVAPWNYKTTGLSEVRISDHRKLRDIHVREMWAKCTVATGRAQERQVPEMSMNLARSASKLEGKEGSVEADGLGSEDREPWMSEEVRI